MASVDPRMDLDNANALRAHATVSKKCLFPTPLFFFSLEIKKFQEECYKEDKIKQFIGFFVTGACPHDPSNIKCCVQRSCLNGGACLDKTRVSCNGGKWHPGFCPGNNKVQCCLKDLRTLFFLSLSLLFLSSSFLSFSNSNGGPPANGNEWNN